jgi:hypothetical protein
MAGLDVADGGDATQWRHGEVDDGDVGMASADQIRSFLDVVRLPADGEHAAPPAAEQQGEALRKEFVVVDDDDHDPLTAPGGAHCRDGIGTPRVAPMRRREADAVRGGDYGLARIVVAVRIAVVVSIAVLLVVGPGSVRNHTAAATAVLVAAMVYSLALLWNPRPEVRRTRYAWLIGIADGSFTLALIGLTGGIHSPVVTVLVLVVIAAAARLSFAEALVPPTPSLGCRRSGGHCI